MLTEKEVADKLRHYGSRFRKYVDEKEWGKAHNVYNIALEVAVFVKMPEEVMQELFGYCADEEKEIDGIFERNTVSRVNKECCIKRNIAYEDMTCRKMGLPLGMFRNYSDEDYCAECEKGKRMRGKEKA